MQRVDIAHLGPDKTMSAFAALAGILLAVSPFALHFHTSRPVVNNDVISGVAIAVLAAIRFMGIDRMAALSRIMVALGLWVLVSPGLLLYSRHATAAWDNVILGAMVVVLACWISLAHDAMRDREHSNRPKTE